LRIVATDEFSEFYDAWNGTFVTPPDLTLLPPPIVEANNLNVVSRIAVVNGYRSNRVTASWGVGGGVLYSRVRAYFDGNLIAEVAEALVPSFEYDVYAAGTFLIEVTPFGLNGAGQTITGSLTLGALEAPPPPESVTLSVGQNGNAATYNWTTVAGAQSYVIQVVASGTTRRTVNVGNSLTYTYTLDDAIADGGAVRAYTFRVYSVANGIQSLTFASVAFSNPQIGLLANARVEPMPNSIWFKCTLPTEADFKAIRIWLSTTSSFTPSSTTVVYEGSDNWVNIAADNDGNPLEAGIVYYLYAAGYDSFGDDNLTLTAQFSASVLSPAWGLIQGDIDEVLLEEGLRDRIDLIDAPATTAGSVAARLQAEADARAQAILDEALSRANEDEALQSQINLLTAASSGDFQDLIAAVQEEQTARIAADAAEAASRETLATQVRGNYSGTDVNQVTTGLIFSERTARTTADTSIASSVTALSSTVTNNFNTLNSSITTESNTRATSDSALSTQINTVSSQATKTRTYSQSSAPTTGMITGDLWFDTDDGNKAYRYSGASWDATDDSRIAANAAAITTEITSRTNADSALANQLTTVSAQATKTRTYYQTNQPATGMITGDLWFDSDDNNKQYRYSGTAWIAADDARIELNTAAISTEATARANADTVLASNITTLQTTVNGNTTSIQTNATSIDGINGKYTVKIDNNGYVAGYGLISTANNGTPTAEFAIIADRFSIAPVATNPSAVDGSPFFVLTAPQVISGVTVPAGTYMKSAFIHDATITTAKIGDAQITNAKIETLDAGKITTGTLDANRIATGSIDAKIATITNAQIATLDAGKITTGTLDANRIATGSLDAKIASITNAQIANLDAGKITTGVFNADRIGANSITAAKIDSRNLTIKDSAGNIVLSAGNAVTLDTILNTDNLIPDDGFYSPNFWLNNSSATSFPAGWTASNGSNPSQPVSRFIQINSTAGTFDYISKSWSVSAGKPYRVRLWMYMSPDFAGFISPSIHFPLVAWAVPGNTVADPLGAFPAGHTLSSWGGTGWRAAEGVWGTNISYSFLQTRLAGRVTSGYCEIYMEVLPVAESFINQGAFSTLNQINSSNISTYIAAAAIGNAYIGDAQITTAKIGTAQIDTLRIAGNAVTTMGTLGGTTNQTIYLNAPYGGQLAITMWVDSSPDYNFSYDPTVRLYVDGVLRLELIGDQVYAGESGGGDSGGYPIYFRSRETRVLLVSLGAGTHTVTVNTPTYIFYPYAGRNYAAICLLTQR
jgi:hypothetical protein